MTGSTGGLGPSCNHHLVYLSIFYTHSAYPCFLFPKIDNAFRISDSQFKPKLYWVHVAVLLFIDNFLHVPRVLWVHKQKECWKHITKVVSWWPPNKTDFYLFFLKKKKPPQSQNITAPDKRSIHQAYRATTIATTAMTVNGAQVLIIAPKLERNVFQNEKKI